MISGAFKLMIKILQGKFSYTDSGTDGDDSNTFILDNLSSPPLSHSLSVNYTERKIRLVKSSLEDVVVMKLSTL